MAKKKKRRRPPSPATTPRSPERPTSGRQERREAARLRREQEVKAARRRSALTRAAIGGLVGVLVFVAITWFLNRAPDAQALSTEAVAAASAAGCSDLQTPDPGTPSREHLAAGAPYSYSQQPATSGPHDPSPLPGQPRVYDASTIGQYRETMAVHSLEHGSVIMYYRASGDEGGLPVGVVDALTPIAINSPATYLIPYASLPDGTALAFTAWNKLLTCPAKITPAQATTVAQGFVNALACTDNAPEGSRGDGCPHSLRL